MFPEMGREEFRFNTRGNLMGDDRNCYWTTNAALSRLCLAKSPPFLWALLRYDPGEGCIKSGLQFGILHIEEPLLKGYDGLLGKFFIAAP